MTFDKRDFSNPSASSLKDDAFFSFAPDKVQEVEESFGFFSSFGSDEPQESARDAIRTHEPLQERILSPSELAGLSYPRALNYYPSITKKNPISLCRSVVLSADLKSMPWTISRSPRNRRRELVPAGPRDLVNPEELALEEEEE
jgi:hypothetical protein